MVVCWRESVFCMVACACGWLGVFKVCGLQGAGNRWGMRNGFAGDFFWSFGGILRVFLFWIRCVYFSLRCVTMSGDKARQVGYLPAFSVLD